MNTATEYTGQLTRAITDQTTGQLVELWEISDSRLARAYANGHTEEAKNVTTLRGFLQNELERRNPTAFDAWLDANVDSPRAFYL